MHVVLGILFMWLKGLQLVAQLLEGVVTKSKVAPYSLLVLSCAWLLICDSST